MCREYGFQFCGSEDEGKVISIASALWHNRREGSLRPLDVEGPYSESEERVRLTSR